MYDGIARTNNDYCTDMRGDEGNCSMLCTTIQGRAAILILLKTVQDRDHQRVRGYRCLDRSLGLPSLLNIRPTQY
jgi:hypothetical protein